MSKYEELKTEIRHTRFLAEALTELGHAPELHPQGVTILGYGRKPHPDPAIVAVRKTPPYLADFGFTQNKDGRLSLVVDDLDRQYILGEAWMGRLLQTYKERETMATAAAKGYAFQGREVIQTAAGPQIRLQFAAR